MKLRNGIRRAMSAVAPLSGHSRRCSLVWLATVAWAAILLGGCSGGREGVELVQVSGRVMCDQGPMPAAGQVLFVPRETAAEFSSNRPLRPASATFDTDGAFQATSWTPGDGLVPGTYAVVVECWQVPQTMGGPAAKSFIAEVYRAAETTPLKIVVSSEKGPLKVSFDVTRQP